MRGAFTASPGGDPGFEGAGRRNIKPEAVSAEVEQVSARAMIGAYVEGRQDARVVALDL